MKTSPRNNRFDQSQAAKWARREERRMTEFPKLDRSEWVLEDDFDHFAAGHFSRMEFRIIGVDEATTMTVSSREKMRAASNGPNASTASVEAPPSTMDADVGSW